MTSKTKDIIYGDVELDDTEFEPRHVKVRVTTMIDEDVVTALRRIAEEKGQKYQTLLNQVLRAFVQKNAVRRLSPITERRIRTIVREEMRKRA
jgi:uncharacterized protein (DUF4415 family)